MAMDAMAGSHRGLPVAPRAEAGSPELLGRSEWIAPEAQPVSHMSHSSRGRDSEVECVCVCVDVRLVVGNMFVTFLFFHSVGNFIIPIDELRFFGGVAIPPTRCRYQHPRSRSPCCSCAVNWRRRGVGAARRRRSCLVQGRV